VHKIIKEATLKSQGIFDPLGTIVILKWHNYFNVSVKIKVFQYIAYS
jgi:hypothetical protein